MTKKPRQRMIWVKAPKQQLLGVCLADRRKAWAGYRYVRVRRVKVDLKNRLITEVIVATCNGDMAHHNGFAGKLMRLRDRREFTVPKNGSSVIGIVRGALRIPLDEYYLALLTKRGVLEMAKPLKTKTKRSRSGGDSTTAASPVAQRDVPLPDEPALPTWYLVDEHCSRSNGNDYTSYNAAMDAACDGEFVRSKDCQHTVAEDHLICARCYRCSETLDSNDICTACGGVDENANVPPLTDAKKNPKDFKAGDVIIGFGKTYDVVVPDKRGMAKLRNRATGKIEEYNSYNNKVFVICPNDAAPAAPAASAAPRVQRSVKPKAVKPPPKPKPAAKQKPKPRQAAKPKPLPRRKSFKGFDDDCFKL